MIDVDTPSSDGWWLRRLARQMHEKPGRITPRLGDARRCDFTRNEWLDMLWARFVGDAPLNNLAEEQVQSTRDFLRLSKTNYAGLIVRAVQDRTHFTGAASSADADADGDDTVRDLLTSNGPFMDDAVMYAYTLGAGFVLVSPPQEGAAVATATAEDPRQIAVSTDPVNRNRLRAGLKLYRDDDLGQDVAHLYLPADADGPDRVRVAVRTGAAFWSGARFTPTQWDWDEDRSGPNPEATQGLGVPLVPLVNLLGMGEFEPHLDVLDRITNGIADRLWSAKFQLFIQRALELEEDLPANDPVTGQPIDYNALFSADPGSFWKLPKGAKVWEGRQLDINAFLAPVRDDLKELSSVSQTPMHMFTPDAMTGSAEGASTMKETLTLKAEDRISRFTPASVRVARLGLAYSGKPYDGELHAMWGPTERYSLQQRGAAAVQAKTSGVPTRSILSDVWQFPPSVVARMEKERRADLLYETEQAAGQ